MPSSLRHSARELDSADLGAHSRISSCGRIKGIKPTSPVPLGEPAPPFASRDPRHWTRSEELERRVVWSRWASGPSR